MAFCSKTRVALGLSNPGRVSKVENLESFSLPEHARTGEKLRLLVFLKTIQMKEKRSIEKVIEKVTELG